MIKDIPNKFWERWYATTDRPKILRELTILHSFGHKCKVGMSKEVDAAMEHSFYTLINSYLEDLMIWIQDKEEEPKMKDTKIQTKPKKDGGVFTPPSAALKRESLN